MGQQNSKAQEKDKQSELPQINFLNIASGSGLSIPSRQRSPNNSQQIVKEQVWNTIFRWPFGGENVSVTGSFTNWKTPIPLAKVGNEFNIILALPAGVHKYKFIVDGEWKFSLLDPTCLDESGNVNNILDTTHYNPKVSEAMVMGSGSGFIDKGSSNAQPLLGNNSKISNQAVRKPPEEAKKAEITPKSTTPKNQKLSEFNDGDFDVEAQITPPHLMDIYFVNEKEKKIKEVWRKDDAPANNGTCTEGIFRAFESFNSISPPTHVVLNHCGGKKTSLSENNMVYVLTERFKGKYATIKFYTVR